MVFKASNIIPQKAYQIVKQAAVQLKINCQSFNSFLSANNADYDYLRGIYRTLERANNQFASLKTTPGLAQFSKDQENDPTYSVGAEFTAMQDSIAAALAWMDTNIPTNVTLKTPANWGDGTLVSNTFTPAQTSGLRTEINTVIAAIE